jgi:amino acid transporter
MNAEAGVTVKESTTREHRTGLRSGSVGLAGASAQSAAMIGPAVGVTASNIFIASLTGDAAPFAFIIGMLIAAVIAVVIGMYARKLPSAGSFYTYLTNTFGPKTGFVTGVMLFGAYLMVLIFQVAFFGTFIHAEVENLGVNIPWQVFGLALLALSLTLTVLGVRLSLRVGLIGVAFEVTVFLVLAIIIMVHGGATGNSLQPFNPGAAPKVSNIGLAVVYTIFAFAGFEGSTTLGEEAREPTRTIPWALILTVLSIGVFYVVVTYAEVIGFGVSKSGLSQLQTNQTPFTDLATRYSSGVLSVFITLATISSFVALNIATIVTGSRMIHAMGRDRLLPRVFGNVSRFRTPANAAYAVGAWAVIFTLIFGALNGPENAASYFSFIGTLFTIVAYALVAVGAVWLYYRNYRSEFSWIRHGLTALVALAGIGWVAYGNVHPTPAPPLDYFIYLTLALIVVGVVTAAILERRNPQRMLDAGHLFTAAHSSDTL